MPVFTIHTIIQQYTLTLLFYIQKKKMVNLCEYIYENNANILYYTQTLTLSKNVIFGVRS